MSESISKAAPWLVASVFLAAFGLVYAIDFIPGLPMIWNLVLVTFTFELVLFGWLLGVGLYFNPRLVDGPLVPDLIPKGAFVFTLAYVLFGVPAFFSAHASGGVPAVFMLVHFLAVAANFFLLWFGCCALRSFELGHKASFSEFAGVLFLVWLLCIPAAIGPFIVQFRVRRLATGGAAT